MVNRHVCIDVYVYVVCVCQIRWKTRRRYNIKFLSENRCNISGLETTCFPLDEGRRELKSMELRGFEALWRPYNVLVRRRLISRWPAVTGGVAAALCLRSTLAPPNKPANFKSFVGLSLLSISLFSTILRHCCYRLSIVLYNPECWRTTSLFYLVNLRGRKYIRVQSGGDPWQVLDFKKRVWSWHFLTSWFIIYFCLLLLLFFLVRVTSIRTVRPLTLLTCNPCVYCHLVSWLRICDVAWPGVLGVSQPRWPSSPGWLPAALPTPPPPLPPPSGVFPGSTWHFSSYCSSWVSTWRDG